MKRFIVNIQRLTRAIQRLSFGTILIVTDEKTSPYTKYNSLSAVLEDYANTTEAYKIAASMFAQQPRPREIAIVGANEATPAEIVTLLGVLYEEGKEFYGLATTVNTDAGIETIAAWVETKDKLYAVTTQNKAYAVDTWDRTFVAYAGADVYHAEALLAYMLVSKTGGVDAHFKSLAGIPEAELTLTEQSTLDDNNIMFMKRERGLVVNWGGNTLKGSPIDEIIGMDWIKNRMEEGLARVQANKLKIPYSDEGIALLVDVVIDTLKRAAFDQDIVLIDSAGNAVFDYTYLTRDEVDPNDVALRIYNGLEWTAKLASSIRGGEISGILEY